MFRKRERREKQYTQPDHRPMIPELRQPEDQLDAAIKNVRRRYDEMNPGDYLKWR